MKDYCAYVNVFQGSGEIDLPKPQGVAASWHFIKALCGNTHPGVVLPFGKMSCCPYSSGYSSGYGRHLMNCGEPIKKFSDTIKLKGFSHLNQSGIGALGLYYNYAVTTPFFGKLNEKDALKDISTESGTPGYYSATIEPEKTKCELTMAEKCAVHRYSFADDSGRIAVDFSNDGLYEPLKAYSEHSELEIISETRACASVIMQGVCLYFFVECRGAKASALWQKNCEIIEKRKAINKCRGSFGCVFEIEGREAEIRLSVSTKSVQMAQDFVLNEKRSFEEIRSQAYSKWNEALSKIEIASENQDDYEIFYSNLYHSLIKPCDWSGESFIDSSDGDFCVDFCTLWDIYKTQLPLVFSLYPNISSKIINTFIKLCNSLGYLPNNFVLTNNFSIESKQACMLSEHIITDAYLRNVPNVDYGQVLDIVMKDFNYEYYENFLKFGTLEKTTKVMDISEACKSIALIAHELGREDTAQELEKLYNSRTNVFDCKTGLLKANYDYYEGNLWNYSFRPMHDMEKRIAFCGGKESFVKLLDRFFGFTQPEIKSARFEGFNNETDMETPYTYHYVERHDRISEIIDSMHKYSFTKGRGGIPGNNDSGGLSSCYVWNCVGIFPVSGKDLMIIGLPCFNRVVMHLSSGKDFCIEKKGRGIYIQEAYFNGARLSDLSLSVREMMKGGRLEITVGENKK